ncbi:MAG: hypothetical protein JXA14_02330 [Anaerolineae bacterium]|nr:hypothetical protein [Anaerolineae bacterium]
MTCYDEFPISTVVYNWATAAGVMALGAVVAVQFGVAVLVGYVLLLTVAAVGILATTCARCESYYGHRCGLGLGKVVSVFFKQKRTDLYLRTPVQFVYVGLLLAGLVWPVVGGVVLLVQGFSVWRLVQLAAAAVLLLAFGVPHPKLVCSHCRQGECGACPAGRTFRRR